MQHGLRGPRDDFCIICIIDVERQSGEYSTLSLAQDK
jgi:hypothetical protein